MYYYDYLTFTVLCWSVLLIKSNRQKEIYIISVLRCHNAYYIITGELIFRKIDINPNNLYHRWVECPGKPRPKLTFMTITLPVDTAETEEGGRATTRQC